MGRKARRTTSPTGTVVRVKHLVRTFVGLRCGRAVRERMHALATDLARDDRALKVPPIQDLHVTVQFLGDTPQEDLAPLGEALREAASAVPPIEVTYGGLGAFPNAQRPRVLWAGVREPEGQDLLPALARAVGRSLQGLGYRPERRAFHAHVTLVRVHRRPGPAVFQALEAARGDCGHPAFGTEILSDLRLILSDPGNRPYHYIDLTTVPLAGRV
jgi:2'-5' RNA ligase